MINTQTINGMYIVHVLAVAALLVINMVYLSGNAATTTQNVSTYMDSGIMFGVDEHWHLVGDVITCFDLTCVLSNDILYNPNATMIVFSAWDPYKSEIKLILPDQSSSLLIPGIMICTWCSILLIIDIFVTWHVLCHNRQSII